MLTAMRMKLLKASQKAPPEHQHVGVSENVVYPIVPNGFADHYPVFKWLFHWEYTLFSDKPMSNGKIISK